MKNKSFLISAFMLIFLTAVPENIFASRSSSMRNFSTKYQWLEYEITSETDLTTGSVVFDCSGKIKLKKLKVL